MELFKGYRYYMTLLIFLVIFKITGKVKMTNQINVRLGRKFNIKFNPYKIIAYKIQNIESSIFT